MGVLGRERSLINEIRETYCVRVNMCEVLVIVVGRITAQWTRSGWDRSPSRAPTLRDDIRDLEVKKNRSGAVRQSPAHTVSRSESSLYVHPREQ